MTRSTAVLLRNDRIGVEAIELPTQIITVYLRLHSLQPMLRIIDESLTLRRTVQRSILLMTTKEIVGDIIGVPQLIALNYTPVNHVAHHLIALGALTCGGHLQLIIRKRPAD